MDFEPEKSAQDQSAEWPGQKDAYPRQHCPEYIAHGSIAGPCHSVFRVPRKRQRTLVGYGITLFREECLEVPGAAVSDCLVAIGYTLGASGFPGQEEVSILPA